MIQKLLVKTIENLTEMFKHQNFQIGCPKASKMLFLAKRNKKHYVLNGNEFKLMTKLGLKWSKTGILDILDVDSNFFSKNYCVGVHKFSLLGRNDHLKSGGLVYWIFL